MMCALMQTIYMHARSNEHCQFPCQAHIDQAKVSTENMSNTHGGATKKRKKYEYGWKSIKSNC